MTRLVCLRPVRHHDDVAWLRDLLNAAGYTASDADIQDAYSAWSQDRWCSLWSGFPKTTSRRGRAEILKRLMQHLVPEAAGAPAGDQP
jgi:hypothetical protein